MTALVAAAIFAVGVVLIAWVTRSPRFDDRPTPEPPRDWRGDPE